MFTLIELHSALAGTLGGKLFSFPFLAFSAFVTSIFNGLPHSFTAGSPGVVSQTPSGSCARFYYITRGFLMSGVRKNWGNLTILRHFDFHGALSGHLEKISFLSFSAFVTSIFNGIPHSFAAGLTGAVCLDPFRIFFLQFRLLLYTI